VPAVGAVPRRDHQVTNPAGLQDAEHLPDARLLLGGGDVLDDSPGDHHVEKVVLKGYRLGKPFD
jgi:hypothetical protein